MTAYPYTDTDLDVMGRTLYGEARGESLPGKVAVAWVIRNRAQAARDYCVRTSRTRHPLYGDGTPATVCQMPYQFSCWNQNDPNRAKLLALDTSDPVFEGLRDVAHSVLDGSTESPVGDATHYVVNSLVTSTAWTKDAKQVAVIGGHTFFRAVP